ncbi:MAG: hypothetical protein ACK5MQ_10645 [Pikeienuella sp.]
MTTLNQTYGYLERLLAPQGRNSNSCDWFELDSAPDMALLEQAAISVSRRHAALQAITSLGGKDGWSWRRDPNARPQIHYQRLPGACPDDAPDRLVRRNIWEMPLELESGPPWRLHVTEYDDLTILQSVTTHIYTCGKSANLISVELFRAYDLLARGLRPDDSPVEVPDRRNTRLFQHNWRAIDHLRAFAGTTVGLMRELFTSPMKLAGDTTDIAMRGRSRVEFVDLGPELWRQLRCFARSEGVSRHPFYLAAWSEALSAYNTRHGMRVGPRVKFMDNFSLRAFSKQNLDGFYDLTAVPYAIEVPSGPSTRDKRQAIFADVEELRAGKILRELTRYEIYHNMMRFLPVVLTTKLLLKMVIKSRFILSNVGPVPPELLINQSLPVRRYFSFPQLFPPGKVMLLINTTPDTVRAIFLWDEDAIGSADMKNELIPGFRTALARSIELPPESTPVA